MRFIHSAPAADALRIVARGDGTGDHAPERCANSIRSDHRDLGDLARWTHRVEGRRQRLLQNLLDVFPSTGVKLAKSTICCANRAGLLRPGPKLVSQQAVVTGGRSKTGWDRGSAAKIGGLDRRTLPDGVHRFNAAVADLVDNWTSGPTPRLAPAAQRRQSRVLRIRQSKTRLGPHRASNNAIEPSSLHEIHDLVAEQRDDRGLEHISDDGVDPLLVSLLGFD